MFQQFLASGCPTAVKHAATINNTHILVVLAVFYYYLKILFFA
jgi:hypothetical protein